MIETSADRAAIYADWHTLVIGATTVGGIFTNGYFEADDTAGSQPTFFCDVASLPSITYGTTTGTVVGVTYRIMRTEPDGEGATLLTLEKV